MDRIEKALKKLVPKEREMVKQILAKLIRNEIEDFDTKKLKGRDDIFRIRKSGVRIIYRRDGSGGIFILRVDRRREDTYKF